MARLSGRILFFTTSPRTPEKMIPEIRLLHEKFEGCRWNSDTQAAFYKALTESDFFEGSGISGDPAFSARDRITRAPKMLGFVDLEPRIHLTEAGQELVYGKRPQEIYLRQLLKFQLPSPYHKEGPDISGTYYVRPYLEILRLIRELGSLSADEIRIFAMQLTDYRRFDVVKEEILHFREEKQAHQGRYKQFVNQIWENEIRKIYRSEIAAGQTGTRESKDDSLKKFMDTKRGNMRDYADACIRYLRYTGLIFVAHKSRTMIIYDDKIDDVDYILQTVPREPYFVDDKRRYKQYLFHAASPVLYADNKANIIQAVTKADSSYTAALLSGCEIEALKDLRDAVIAGNKEEILQEKKALLQSYTVCAEIITTFDELTQRGYYDAPLILEYNTWCAMVMLDHGEINGNFTTDDMGNPLSTASGNKPDILCTYDDFDLIVEVTMQSGQRQYESEGEPVARHYGKQRTQSGRETYCLFLAPIVNEAAFAHFYVLNHMNVSYYGGKTRIIPMNLKQFKRLLTYAEKASPRPDAEDLHRFLRDVMDVCNVSTGEVQWQEGMDRCIDKWLSVEQDPGDQLYYSAPAEEIGEVSGEGNLMVAENGEELR